jgi:hypothetical protein
MWNVELVALLAIINGSIKNYYSIFNFQYSIAMQLHRACRVQVNSRDRRKFTKKREQNKILMWNFECGMWN